ncbi:RES domain-containing protein [Acetobacter pasteurianus NBRC 3280]|uniref:RES domain-containing protein n=2 Tax=Acetobacter pasteurianus TaxID=438 RepID=A0A401X7E5_ACEPA|nr:RES domain-containing protein [Acetobacter pasteurianus]GCD60012.1 RES domain-containing protein [Acetobacter pasteurianus NBRC 3277]GCD63764.1 RES domain-containing protein [Acetobacter pasteurianus NBRC 3278]GCD69921.1 RES domain-containing protein [Acetobacter pasteurianus NBRC 3280]
MHGNTNNDLYICSGCLGDEHIKKFITYRNSNKKCNYCGLSLDPSAKQSEIFGFIAEHVNKSFTCSDYVGFYYVANAPENAPFPHGRYTSPYLLKNILKLELPRDSDGKLLRAICDIPLENKKWASLDFGKVTLDKELDLYWWMFCNITKYNRRFNLDAVPKLFTQNLAEKARLFSPKAIFNLLIPYMKRLVRDIPVGMIFYRSRISKNGEKYTSVNELGPPPCNRSLQSNRMNPPGIPCFYASETREGALLEVRATNQDSWSLGVFETIKPIRILDLTNLPEVGSFFSDNEINDQKAIKFLHNFSSNISFPVTGDDRTHLEYIPTQVLAELVRDCQELSVWGIRYRSAVQNGGESYNNIVLFISTDEIEGSVKRSTLIDDQEILKEAYKYVELIKLNSIEHSTHKCEYISNNTHSMTAPSSEVSDIISSILTIPAMKTAYEKLDNAEKNKMVEQITSIINLKYP